MACSQDSLTVRPACQRYEGYRTGRQGLAQLLCAIAQALEVPEFTCNEETLDALATPTEGVCLGEATLRQIQTQNIYEGLGADIDLLNCKSDAQIELIIASLECTIIDFITAP
jgi:hypothetical protein